jgi:cell wall-associated NlpC family hydrolase
MSAPDEARDPRLTPARPDLAAAELEGIVAAARYAPGRAMTLAAPAAPLHRAPDAGSERLDELVFGERFEALETQGGFVWGQARRDGHVGFVAAEALGPAGAPPTHRIAAIRTYAFAEPSIKSPAMGPFSLNALVTVAAEEDRFSRADGAGWFWTAHLAPIGTFERDPAAVAERFIGAPYLWGGRTSLGLDCSGLIQQALYACGRAFSRDADLQLAEGRAIARAELSRGDLVGWTGHIGMMLDATRLVHATAHHMAVAVEPVAEVIARNEDRGPAMFRRL